jgi:hypothetical protein
MARTNGTTISPAPTLEGIEMHTVETSLDDLRDARHSLLYVVGREKRIETAKRNGHAVGQQVRAHVERAAHHAREAIKLLEEIRDTFPLLETSVESLEPRTLEEIAAGEIPGAMLASDTDGAPIVGKGFHRLALGGADVPVDLAEAASRSLAAGYAGRIEHKPEARRGWVQETGPVTPNMLGALKLMREGHPGSVATQYGATMHDVLYRRGWTALEKGPSGTLADAYAVITDDGRDVLAINDPGERAYLVNTLLAVHQGNEDAAANIERHTGAVSRLVRLGWLEERGGHDGEDPVTLHVTALGESVLTEGAR